MRIFFLTIFFFLPLFCEKGKEKVFHKTVGQIESYKEKVTLNLKPGCIRRLTKNLLTPIHKRKRFNRNKTEEHLIKKYSDGPLTVKFLLPVSLKKEILALLSKNSLVLSIPLPNNESIDTDDLEIDRYANPPQGLFAMKSRIDTERLSPSEVIFIHLLRDDA